MNRWRQLSIVAILLLITSALAAQEMKSARADGFTLRWRVVESDLEVEVTAPTTGWVGVGFDPGNMMGGANIIMGYVADGEVTISDQYGSGRTRHQPDTELGGASSVTDVGGTERFGRTTLSFTIPLDSGEETDNPLTPGNTHTVMMAHGPDDADNFITYHGGNRTIIEITL